MKAERLLNERHQLSADRFVELRGLACARSVRGPDHDLKYALAFVVGGLCVVRYGNEAGKGDHRHVGSVETACRLTTAAALLADFWADVDGWRP